MAAASNNLAVYVAGPRVELDAFPVNEDGFQYTDATYLTCLEASRQIPFDKTKCHKPDQANGFGYASRLSGHFEQQQQHLRALQRGRVR